MIIDAHTHIYPDKIAVKASQSISDFYTVRMKYNGTVSALLEMGEKAGVEKFVAHSVATMPHQVDSINEFIASAVAENHGRLIGFATLHPDSENIPEQVDKAIEMGLSGVKLHPDFQKFYVNSRRALKLFEVIEGRLPVLIHAGDYRTEYSKAERIVEVLHTFPKLDVIAAHFGGWSEWGVFAEELAEAGSYVDTSSSQFFIEPEKVRELMDVFGTDRVFFGSDYPMFDAGEELEMLAKIPMTPDERENIYHRNFERLMAKYTKN